jgi:hypothetical protein
MSLFLLCGYYPSSEDLPPVKIIGIFNSYKEAKEIQYNKCGCITKINRCWVGQRGIITWIIESDTGLLAKAIDIRYTHDAVDID